MHMIDNAFYFVNRNAFIYLYMNFFLFRRYFVCNGVVGLRLLCSQRQSSFTDIIQTKSTLFWFHRGKRFCVHCDRSLAMSLSLYYYLSFLYLQITFFMIRYNVNILVTMSSSFSSFFWLLLLLSLCYISLTAHRHSI